MFFFVFFVPRINRDLDHFLNQWNHHPLKTEHHKNPLQLFVSKSLSMYNSSHTPIKDLFHLEQSVSTTASPDNDSSSHLSAQPDWRDSVKVPAISCRLNEEDYHDLPLYDFPERWNKWNQRLENINSQGQYKKKSKKYLLSSYMENVKCANLYCKECHKN